MKCPYCGNLGDKVVDSRESREGDVIRRRRECLECGKRFTSYERIDDEGLYITNGKDQRVLAVDNVVICAGQEPLRELQAPLQERGIEVHLIGGADVAAELDAKRAIDQGARVAAAL